MPTPSSENLRFRGAPLRRAELEFIQRTARQFSRLSRTELAATLCDQLGWLRPSGKPKTVECRQYLETLEQRGLVDLPPPRIGRPKGSTTRIEAADKPPSPIHGALAAIGPVPLERVSNSASHTLWRSRMEQYHYQGCKTPFGAHLRYHSRCPKGELGGIQFSSVPPGACALATSGSAGVSS